MLIIQDNTIVVGNTAPNVYTSMKPWQHESGAFWWTIDEVDFTHVVDGHKLRRREESEFNSTEPYIEWQAVVQDATRAAAIQNIRWKGLITLDAQGEFTWQHDLDFTQYIVLLSPFGQSMPDLYLDATANSISVYGGAPGGKVVYKIELDLRPE